ncbi:hypothetical protein JQX13_09470 [Archangium violaceum]|uniref:hypothetical protein n=1 Tax=Archangium violaceum TaxID=83451 RepID=UPI00193C1A72|nr:hypothetical protein [Archangium violaceum]QRK10292.1 hypothetical protein JQX13_09470 [Archangium violaceum]
MVAIAVAEVLGVPSIRGELLLHITEPVAEETVLLILDAVGELTSTVTIDEGHPPGDVDVAHAQQQVSPQIALPHAHQIIEQAHRVSR